MALSTWQRRSGCVRYSRASVARSRRSFFNSNGGSQTQAMAIGRLIRERGMTAGVWRTVPDGCATLDEKACRQLTQSGEMLTATLRSGAICLSSCVYALLGGTARQVPPGASLVVHISRLVQLRPAGNAGTPPPRTAAPQEPIAGPHQSPRAALPPPGHQ